MKTLIIFIFICFIPICTYADTTIVVTIKTFELEPPNAEGFLSSKPFPYTDVNFSDIFVTWDNRNTRTLKDGTQSVTIIGHPKTSFIFKAVRTNFTCSPVKHALIEGDGLVELTLVSTQSIDKIEFFIADDIKQERIERAKLNLKIIQNAFPNFEDAPEFQKLRDLNIEINQLQQEAFFDGGIDGDKPDRIPPIKDPTGGIKPKIDLDPKVVNLGNILPSGTDSPILPEKIKELPKSEQGVIKNGN